jgi:hypothetical protein
MLDLYMCWVLSVVLDFVKSAQRIRKTDSASVVRLAAAWIELI